VILPVTPTPDPAPGSPPGQACRDRKTAAGAVTRADHMVRNLEIL